MEPNIDINIDPEMIRRALAAAGLNQNNQSASAIDFNQFIGDNPYYTRREAPAPAAVLPPTTPTNPYVTAGQASGGTSVGGGNASIYNNPAVARALEDLNIPVNGMVPTFPNPVSTLVDNLSAQTNNRLALGLDDVAPTEFQPDFFNRLAMGLDVTPMEFMPPPPRIEAPPAEALGGNAVERASAPVTPAVTQPAPTPFINPGMLNVDLSFLRESGFLPPAEAQGIAAVERVAQSTPTPPPIVTRQNLTEPTGTTATELLNQLANRDLMENAMRMAYAEPLAEGVGSLVANAPDIQQMVLPAAPVPPRATIQPTINAIPQLDIAQIQQMVGRLPTDLFNFNFNG
jgi:hypothetical protein